MFASMFWNLFLYTLVGLASVTESTTCRYDDNNGVHYIYCPNSGCCGTYDYQYCCTWRTGQIIGAVIGSLAFIIIVASIITCCCCACCPVYQYKSRDTVITTTRGGPNYQTMPDTSPYPPSTGLYTGPYTAGEYTSPPPYQV